MRRAPERQDARALREVDVPVLLAILVGCAAAMLLIAALRRRSASSGPSIDRYHRAMDVLGALSDRTRPPTDSRGAGDPGVPAASGPGRAVLPVPPPQRPASPRPTGAQPGTRRPRPRRLLPALLVAAAGLALGLGLSLSSGSAGPRRHAAAAPTVQETAPATSARSAPANAGAASRPAATPALHRVPPPSSSPTTSTTSPAPATPAGGAPVVASVEPPSAAPGQTVTVVGSGFTSPDGVVVVTFDGQAAPTRCPSEARCVVTVPPGAAGTAVVHVRTDAGSSNGLPFSLR